MNRLQHVPIPHGLAALAAVLALCIPVAGCFDATYVDDPVLSTSTADTAVSGAAGDPVMDAILGYADDRVRALGIAPTTASSGVYRLESFDSADVDSHVVLGDGSTGIPTALQGLWWMDGNPLADEVLTFGASPWDPARRSTEIVVYDDGVWTWHDDLEGRALYASVRRSELIYELVYDQDLAFAEITPTVAVGPLRVRIPPQIVRFTAERLLDDLWLRKSYLHGRLVHTYALRRIVRPDGQREPAYDEYVAAAPARSLVARRVR
jgi:hypothetical protein